METCIHFEARAEKNSRKFPMIAFLKKIFRKSALAKRVYARVLFVSALVKNNPTNFEKISVFLRVLPYTMVEYRGVNNVYELAQDAVKSGIRGAFVECGVWKGGVAGVMGYVAKKEEKGRLTWLFDSFEGLPEPTSKDGDTAIEYSGKKYSGKLVSIQKCVGLVEDVKKVLFSVLSLKEGEIRMVKGWFQDTLPKAKREIGEIAILRLDADWYESTRCILENLYDLVVQHGYIIIDDYGHWEGCRKAVDEFLTARNLQIKMHQADSMVAYFQKP